MLVCFSDKNNDQTRHLYTVASRGKIVDWSSCFCCVCHSVDACVMSCCRTSFEMLNWGMIICTHGMLFQCLCSTRTVISQVCLFYKVVWSDDWICHSIFSPSRRPLIRVICFSLFFVSLFLDGIWRGDSF